IPSGSSTSARPSVMRRGANSLMRESSKPRPPKCSASSTHLVLLRGPDGSVAGLSEAGWDIRAPSIVRQQLTAVARQWRGRGIGRALKAAVLRQGHEAHPGATGVGTNKAGGKPPILSVNARVGFTGAWGNVGYQGGRGALE